MGEQPPKGTPLVRGTTRGIIQAASQLREEMTPSEMALWEQLRERRLDGLRFRRQHTVGQFILDFYCAHAKLGIELDGRVHQFQAEYDEARTGHMAAFGYTVIRFDNEDIEERMPEVLEEIKRTAKKLIPDRKQG